MLALLGASLASSLKVDPETRRIVDEKGNFKLFHGANVAYKIAPFFPPNETTFDFNDSFSDADALKLRGWGMNSIRLTFYWEAVEPKRGQFDLEYIAHLKNIVNIAGRHGIYVVLDAHQDVANRQFCGEGFPDWAVRKQDTVTKFPFPLKLDLQWGTDGYPTKESCLKYEFGTYYSTYAVMNAYNDLYINHDNLGDAYALMWAEMARHFKDSYNIIGYEIMNEPFVGNLYLDPKILFKSNLLLQLYQRVNSEVRKVDNETIIFFEYPTSDEVPFISSFHGTPGGPAYMDRQMLSYHIYTTPEGDPTSLPFALVASKLLFTHAAKFMNEEKLGGFMTEFGAISGLTKVGNEVIRIILDQADQRVDSWSYWQYKYYNDYTTAARPSQCEGFFDADGNLITAKVKELARPYIPHSSLQITKMHFNGEDTFTVEFLKKSEHSSGLIEAFLSSEFHFANGVEFELRECVGCKITKSEKLHHWNIDHTGANHGKLKIVFRAK